MNIKHGMAWRGNRIYTSAVSWPSRVIQMSRSLSRKPKPFLEEPNRQSWALSEQKHTEHRLTYVKNSDTAVNRSVYNHKNCEPEQQQENPAMFDGGDGVLWVIGSIPPPPSTVSWVDAKELDFGLIWTTLSPSSPLIHWQTSDGPIHVLSWAGTPCGRCRISILHCVACYQLFSWWLLSQLPWSLTRSSRVVLGWFFIVLMIIETPRGEILHGAPDRRRLSYFVFLPFTNNHTNCCHLVPKLLGDGLVAHSSLV